MRIAVLPYGDRALLVELEDTAAVVAYVEALRADEPPGLDDVVPAAETVLVVADSPASVPALRTVLLALSPGDDAAELVGEHDAHPPAIGDGEYQPREKREESQHRVNRNLGEPTRGIKRLHVEHVAEAHEKRCAESGGGERETRPVRPGRRPKHEQHRQAEDRHAGSAAARHAPGR